MTFLEAAIEVLKGSEDALHFKEIARRAVGRKLLSHVGRDPEAAMQSCLNQAVRSRVHDGLVTRAKPGHFVLRPGAALPELPPPPSEPEPLPTPVPEEPTTRKPAKKKPKKSSKKAATSSKKAERSQPPKDKPRRSRSRRKKPAEDEAAASAEASVEETAKPDPATDEPRPDGYEGASASIDSITEAAVAGTPPPMPELDPSKVKFRGPDGSGLEGETDVALVMANAMSRLAVERPELREELEAMQKGQAPVPEIIEVGRKRRRDHDDDRREGEERGGRRRKRRRRKNRRVDWSAGNSVAVVPGTMGQNLLDKVAAVLAEVGPRSLHVRQIAENLASQKVLGGEISEIERAVTSEVLLDVHRRGDASRFSVRGDARYQLRGARLPEKAAAAEHAARVAVRTLEDETNLQLLAWLQSLGARSLESLVRMWLAREDFQLAATLPPSRGLGKLVAVDPDPEDDDGRTLVLIVPRKTTLEPKLWDGEAERNTCGATLVFAMGDAPAEGGLGDARVVFAPELARWLVNHGIGVRTLRLEVPVLDADLIESIGGLDT